MIKENQRINYSSRKFGAQFCITLIGVTQRWVKEIRIKKSKPREDSQLPYILGD
jgi:hypothetical protein